MKGEHKVNFILKAVKQTKMTSLISKRDKLNNEISVADLASQHTSLIILYHKNVTMSIFFSLPRTFPIYLNFDVRQLKLQPFLPRNLTLYGINCIFINAHLL